MTETELDDLVDYWHTHKELKMPLHEYLGWTWHEYALWVHTSEMPKSKQAINRPKFTK